MLLGGPVVGVDPVTLMVQVKPARLLPPPPPQAPELGHPDGTQFVSPLARATGPVNLQQRHLPRPIAPIHAAATWVEKLIASGTSSPSWFLGCGLQCETGEVAIGRKLAEMDYLA